MQCPKCETEYPDGAWACPRCGAGADAPVVQPARTSPWAIAALVLALTVCLSPLGVVAGIVALVRIGKGEGRERGRELAFAGIAVSVLVTIGTIVVVQAMAVAGARNRQLDLTCLAHQQHLAMAITLYGNDWDDTLPRSYDDLAQYRVDPEYYTCPRAPELRIAIGYNRHLAGRRLLDVPGDVRQVVVTADAHGISISRLDEIARKRHRGRYIATFLDGQARMLRPDQAVTIEPDKENPGRSVSGR